MNKMNVVARLGTVGLGLSKWVPEQMQDTLLIRWSRKKREYQRRVGGKWRPFDEWPDKIGYVFRWGCTANLPRPLNVVNKAAGIHLVADKAGFREKMMEGGMALDIPFTRLSCHEWESDTDYEARAVVRTKHHAQGRGLWVLDNHDEVAEKCEELGAGNYYINELIDKVAEYRVFVVSGRVVWVAEKTPGNPEDVAWNVAQGGRFDNVRWGEWPLRVCDVAVRAAELSGLDFVGVDVMVDEYGKPYVLEANSAPSQTSPYRQACTAKAFNWIINNGRDFIPLGDEGKYLRYIHPAIDSKAKIGG